MNKTTAPVKLPPLKPLPAAKLKAFRRELMNLRSDLMAKLEEKKEKDLEVSSVSMTGDDGDIAIQTYEKEMLFEITGNERETVMNVDSALRRIQTKTFGYCERCRKPIPLKRLKVIPYTRYCLPCQSIFEAKRS